MSRGKELFDRDNLGEKGLKKLNKADLVATIELNLEPLCEYYYEDIHHKEEREFRPVLIDLVMDKKLFLKPVAKIAKTNPEAIPEGLAFMIFDTLEMANRNIEDKIRQEQESQKPEEEKKQIIEALNKFNVSIHKNVFEVLPLITTKNIKRLRKIGIKKFWAGLIAAIMLSPDYVTNKNMFRFIRTFTNQLYKIYGRSIEKDESGNKVSTIGIDFKQNKAMDAFFKVVTKKFDTATMAEFVKQLLLEKRDKKMDTMTQDEVNMYGAITNWTLRTLESKEVFNKKTRKAIIKGFGDQRVRDEKRQRDARRRVNFKELDADMYPRIVKAYNEVIGNNTEEKQEN